MLTCTSVTFIDTMLGALFSHPPASRESSARSSCMYCRFEGSTKVTVRVTLFEII